MRTCVLLTLAVLVGCRATNTSPSPADEASPPRDCSLIAVLPPRMLTFSCEDEPTRPIRTLELWLAMLGPEVVRSRTDGEARFYGYYRDDPDDDLLFRWRHRGDASDVQIADPRGIVGDRRFLESLAFAMEVKGVLVEPGPSSGCSPPHATPEGAPSWSDAIAAEFDAMGLGWIDEEIGQGCNMQYYGRAGGPAEWVVAWTGLDGGDPTIELTHLGEPFDAARERDLLVRILRRMGIPTQGL